MRTKIRAGMTVELYRKIPEKVIYEWHLQGRNLEMKKMYYISRVDDSYSAFLINGWWYPKAYFKRV